MTNEFIINNAEIIIKIFGIVLIILIILLVALIRKQKTLSRRVEVLENFETVFYLLKKQKAQPVDEAPEQLKVTDSDMERLNKKFNIYLKQQRGQELTEEEQQLKEKMIEDSKHNQ